MPKFDGDPIVNGDKLFDIYDSKFVTVIQVYKDRFMVRVPGRGNGATRTYDYKGRAARRAGRTLYWHDPRVVIPRKNIDLWQTQKGLVADLLDNIGKHIPDRAPSEADLASMTMDEALGIQEQEVAEVESPDDADSKFQRAVAEAKAQQNLS